MRMRLLLVVALICLIGVNIPMATPGWIGADPEYPGVIDQTDVPSVQIDWDIRFSGTSGCIIPPVTGMGISNYNEITQNISLMDGFLSETMGTVTNPERTAGTSYTRAPTDWEKQLFSLWWPDLNPDNYNVAAMEVWSSVPTSVYLDIDIHDPVQGIISRHTTLNFAGADRLSSGGLIIYPDIPYPYIILGTDGPASMVLQTGTYVIVGCDYPYEIGMSDKKMAWVWVPIVHPNTAVTITPSANCVSPGETVSLDITETNTGDVALTTPYVNITSDPNVLDVTLDRDSISYSGGDVNDDGVLDVGETWSWSVTSGPVTDDTSITAEGHGFYEGNDISRDRGYTDKREIVISVNGCDNFIEHPNTTVTITYSADSVCHGQTVSLNITETNTGDAALTTPYVNVASNPNVLGVTLDRSSISYIGGDVNDDGVLDVGEAWSWSVTTGGITGATSITAEGHGFYEGIDISRNNGYTDKREIIIQVGRSTRGDANMDGFLNMGDVITVEWMIMGLSILTVDADVNGDGVVNMADVILIELILLGLL